MAEVHGAYLATPPSLADQDFTTVPLAQDASLTVHVNNFPPSGDATAAKQDTGNTSLSTINAKVPSLVSGRIPVDGSGVTQTISGTVAVSNFPATQPVSGTVTANIGTSGSLALDSNVTSLSAKFGSVGQKAMSSSAPVVIASDQSTLITKITTSTTNTTTNVAASATNVTLLASNSSRLGATFFNDSSNNLYLKLGSTASTSSFTARLIPNGYYETPFSYTGIITGIWDGTNGNCRVGELT